MSKDIWHDCKKQPPLVDDGELVLMDSNNKFWVGFCEITSDGVSYFANNAEPLKNDFVKYARIDKLITLETELERTQTALELAIATIDIASAALIGCQEADNKYISDITAEDGLELLGKALGKLRLLQKDVK